MSKRKREGEDKLEPDAVDKLEGGGALNTSSSLSAATPSGQAELQTNGSHGTCSPGGAESTPASVDLSKAADLASKAMSSTGGKDGPVKITICGEEVTLKGTAGRRKRKQPVETLILLAYKGRLAMACKNNNMVAALDLYREMKSKEIKQDPSIHQMVLAVCGGSPGERDELDPGNGAVGSYPKSGRESISIDPLAAAAATAAASGCNSAEENTSAAAEAALQILSDVVKDGKTSLPESAYTGVIRACCLDGRADKARQVLESLKRAGGKPRLRTYSPLLEAYSRLDGRLQDCMEIWRDGVSPDQGLTMTEREYLHLITACTRARHEKCFLEVMAEYMEDVLQPRSRRSWEVLKEWFRVAGESKITNPSITTTSTSSPPKDALENSSDAVETDVDVKVDVDETRAAAGNSNGALEEAPSDPPRPPPAVEAADHAWKVSECRVGKDGSCGKCEEVLVSIELSEDDERRLLKQIEVLVCTNEERTRQWEGYRGWLERRGRDRYNVIIDGANLGYYKQNAAAAGELADLRQVDWAVKKYEGEGKKPLVVLHSRHLVEKRLSDEAKEILKRWREAEVIQSCAPKNNDDWYWLYAAVYAGGRVLVLTNDEMRDHHFSMLSHRSFQRWKERHQARFSFGDWDDDMREVVVEEPASYSKRTQKGRGGDSWHVPLEGSDDWLCITRRKEE